MLTSIAQQEIFLMYYSLHSGNNFPRSSKGPSSSHFSNQLSWLKHCTLSPSPASKNSHTSEIIMFIIFLFTNAPAALQLQQLLFYVFHWWPPSQFHLNPQISKNHIIFKSWIMKVKSRKTKPHWNESLCMMGGAAIMSSIYPFQNCNDETSEGTQSCRGSAWLSEKTVLGHPFQARQPEGLQAKQLCPSPSCSQEHLSREQ